MDIVKKESCSILDNLSEAIVSKVEGVACSINYGNNLTIKVFRKIYQKCIDESVLMPYIEDIEHYFSSKKQFIKSE